ncbi:MAG: TatD family hydrolase [Halothiobacillaceae bacterium]
MSLIDTHCHLDFPVFDADRSAVLARAADAGLDALVSVGTEPGGWTRQRAMLADRPADGPKLYLAHGLHPWFLAQAPDDWPDRLQACLEDPPAATQVVAVGEIGLDFGQGMPDEDSQRRVLERQLDLAESLDLPVILHARKSEDRLLWYLRRRPALRGVIHGFTGSDQQARAFVDCGFFIGVGTAITHPGATRLRPIVAGLPETALLLETDAPDQPPAGHRGERNEPAWLVAVLATLADLRGQDPAVLAGSTWDNACRLFALETT